MIDRWSVGRRIRLKEKKTTDWKKSEENPRRTRVTRSAAVPSGWSEFGEAASVRSVILWMAKWSRTSSSLDRSKKKNEQIYKEFQPMLWSWHCCSAVEIAQVFVENNLDSMEVHYHCSLDGRSSVCPGISHSISSLLMMMMVWPQQRSRRFDCSTSQSSTHRSRDYSKQRKLDVSEWSYRRDWHCLKPLR